MRDAPRGEVMSGLIGIDERKAGIILMARIKYQEAIGLEVKRGSPPVGPPLSQMFEGLFF